MSEPQSDPLEWPSGQRRWPLRDSIRFTPALCRAGRALLGWSVQTLANRAGDWPRYVGVTETHVESLESGRELPELHYAAICEALYHEGYGVVVIKPGNAGEGVRFAKPEEVRAEGTYNERRWRPVLERWQREAERQIAWEAHMTELHGAGWWRDDLSRLLAPPPGWEPAERTNGQSGVNPGKASRAP